MCAKPPAALFHPSLLIDEMSDDRSRLCSRNFYKKTTEKHIDGKIFL